MKISQQVIVKRWKPILEEYEKIQNKVIPRPFRFVKDLCLAYHISSKELRRYFRKWQEGKKQDDSLLPARRGARPGSRRTPKKIERNIMKAYRKFGSNYYPLNPTQKKIIKNKFFYPNSFDSVKDLIYNLGNFLFEYNHLRRHGGLEYITPYEKLEKVTELLS